MRSAAVTRGGTRASSCPPGTIRGRHGTSIWPTPPTTMDEAERLYYGACSTALCKRAFCALAADLEQNAPEAGRYLRWLMVSGQTWPRVTPSGTRCLTECDSMHRRANAAVEASVRFRSGGLVFSAFCRKLRRNFAQFTSVRFNTHHMQIIRNIWISAYHGKGCLTRGNKKEDEVDASGSSLFLFGCMCVAPVGVRSVQAVARRRHR